MGEDTHTRILFFLRTSNGNILEEDKITMRRVAQALGENFKENGYGIIFNKFPVKVYQAHQQNKQKQQDFLDLFWKGMTVNGKLLPRSKHFIFNPVQEDLDSAEDTFVELSDEMTSFLEDMTPVLIEKKKVASVSLAGFDEELNGRPRP